MRNPEGGAWETGKPRTLKHTFRMVCSISSALAFQSASSTCGIAFWVYFARAASAEADLASDEDSFEDGSP
tara:strand:+ start:3207 stop:3419 length:213 start_codon:yes stop_codon:yes gene_type:complete